MSHMIEDTVVRLRDRIGVGSVLLRRYWLDHSTPFTATGLKEVEQVKFDEDGWMTIWYESYDGDGKSPTRKSMLFYPDDEIALRVDGEGTRLILPGGYLDAVSGGNLREWDVFRSDGTLLARKAGMLRARDLLEEFAPEMIWKHHGDGKWTARGHGFQWKVSRGSRNPGYDVHKPIWTSWFYTLSRRDVALSWQDDDESGWEVVVADQESPGAARAGVRV